MKASKEELRAWLAQPATVVAPLLLGWTITHATADDTVSIELTEVEAYGGQEDPASHAWRGLTPRNAVMYGPAGLLYVYLSHGLHACANVVAGPEGAASAVLLRAGRVVDGVEAARVRRGPVADTALARGPGNLGKSLGLSVGLSGLDLFGSPGLALRPPRRQLPQVLSGPRVGVSRAADVPWRYWLAGEPTVSAFRRGTARTP